ncbi:MAG: GNAT family N-acetyltransferase [Promethearchaeota archaeon]
MTFAVRTAQGKDDMDFFFKLGFETLKTLRESYYNRLLEDNPGKSDDELLLAYRKENEDYCDFNSPETRVFIAEAKDRVRCGYLWTGKRNSRDPWDLQEPQWIYDIVVVPAFQGQGLGKKLMAKAEEFAIERNRNIGLFVHADNSRALALYERTGYLVRVVPISRKLDAEESESGLIEEFLIEKEEESERGLVRESEYQRFRRKVEFSRHADDEDVNRLFDEHSSKYIETPEKHLRLIGLTGTGELAGLIWAGISEFNEKIVSIYELLVDTTHKRNELAKILEHSAGKWARSLECSALYILLHAKDDFDLDFFKSIGYSVPGYFMEKRLID